VGSSELICAESIARQHSQGACLFALSNAAPLDLAKPVLTLLDDRAATTRAAGDGHVAFFAPAAAITIPSIDIDTDPTRANADAGLGCCR
jgi:hypothetical protein